MIPESDRLKQLRNALNLKQGEFADKISTTQGHISDIENGRKNLSDRTIKLICLEDWNGEKVNEEWLRNGTGEMFEQMTGQEKLLKYTALLLKDKDSAVASAIQALIVTYEQLDDTSKATLEKIALQYIENMKKSQQPGPLRLELFRKITFYKYQNFSNLF